jgi:quercetin dioxygenase-like cupin family protein
MEFRHLSYFRGGWFIGDFQPSILQTKNFEVGVLHHKKGEEWPAHYHKEAEEYNVLVKGKMKVKGIHLYEGDVFVFKKGEVADPVFLEDCTVVCVKVPSVPGDKYVV